MELETIYLSPCQFKGNKTKCSHGSEEYIGVPFSEITKALAVKRSEITTGLFDVQAVKANMESNPVVSAVALAKAIKAKGIYDAAKAFCNTTVTSTKKAIGVSIPVCKRIRAGSKDATLIGSKAAVGAAMAGYGASKPIANKALVAAKGLLKLRLKVIKVDQSK